MTNNANAEQIQQSNLDDLFAPDPAWSGGGDFSRAKDDGGFWAHDF